MESWCTIESDPGVFTQLIQEIGVEGVQVVELLGLDESSLDPLDHIYGFIFLFKWDNQPIGLLEGASYAASHDKDSGIFFAQQLVPNACATQAILSVLLNSNNTVQLGSCLADFKSFTADFTPEMRGLSLSNCERIKRVHNSFARPESTLLGAVDEDQKGGEDEDQFHFIALLPVGDSLYELDGQHPAPISYGPSNGHWTRHALEIVRRKIEAFAGEIRFNLMAVVADRIRLLEGMLLEKAGGDDLVTSKLMLEREIRQTWAQENARRRHLMFPLILGLLESMVNKDLIPL